MAIVPNVNVLDRDELRRFIENIIAHQAVTEQMLEQVMLRMCLRILDDDEAGELALLKRVQKRLLAQRQEITKLHPNWRGDQ